PWGPAAWRGKVRTAALAGAGGSPRWLSCQSNPLRWDSRSAFCLPVGASQRCSRSHLRGAGGPGRPGQLSPVLSRPGAPASPRAHKRCCGAPSRPPPTSQSAVRRYVRFNKSSYVGVSTQP
ncbi:unnamed protein product, partial [Rangifer tarandus platyrhynchus]